VIVGMIYSVRETRYSLENGFEFNGLNGLKFFQGFQNTCVALVTAHNPTQFTL